MDEAGKYYPKWKRPVTKGHLLYDSILYEMRRIDKSIEKESRSVVTQGRGSGQNGEWLQVVAGLFLCWW